MPSCVLWEIYVIFFLNWNNRKYSLIIITSLWLGKMRLISDRKSCCDPQYELCADVGYELLNYGLRLTFGIYLLKRKKNTHTFRIWYVHGLDFVTWILNELDLNLDLVVEDYVMLVFLIIYVVRWFLCEKKRIIILKNMNNKILGYEFGRERERRSPIMTPLGL